MLSQYNYLDPVTVPGFSDDPIRMEAWFKQYYGSNWQAEYANWAAGYMTGKLPQTLYPTQIPLFSWGQATTQPTGYTWLLVLGGALVLGLLIFKPKKR